jgi:hypothetical protein
VIRRVAYHGDPRRSGRRGTAVGRLGSSLWNEGSAIEAASRVGIGWHLLSSLSCHVVLSMTWEPVGEVMTEVMAK